MHFVDEQHVALVQIGQQRGKIALLFNGRTARHAQVDAHLVGNDAGKRRLAETGRTVQQHMVEAFAAFFCRFDKYF